MELTEAQKIVLGEAISEAKEWRDSLESRNKSLMNRIMMEGFFPKGVVGNSGEEAEELVRNLHKIGETTRKIQDLEHGWVAKP